MQNAAITGYIDVAQLVLYAFWLFFIGLIFYLRQEDRREGYPLRGPDGDRRKPVKSGIFPMIPSPKQFLLDTGELIYRPSAPNEPEVAAKPAAPWPGAPLVPTGDPMVDGVGPAAYALREEKPDMTMEGETKIAPMRVATEFSIAPGDPDPRGMAVVGADGEVAGTVSDVWVDRPEVMIRYLELSVGGKSVMLPMTFAKVDAGKGQVRVKSILARHFATVPVLAKPDEINRREEDRICAYYASGHLYATEARSEPLL